MQKNSLNMFRLAQCNSYWLWGIGFLLTQYNEFKKYSEFLLITIIFFKKTIN